MGIAGRGGGPPRAVRNAPCRLGVFALAQDALAVALAAALLLGTALLGTANVRSGAIQRLLTNRTAVYAGEISFALYMVQSPVMFGWRVATYTAKATGVEVFARATVWAAWAVKSRAARQIR